MPIHDWTRADDGTYHAFHTAWITHLSEALNGGLLPQGYYALPEQHIGRLITDVLTLQRPLPEQPTLGQNSVSVLQTPPQVSRKLLPSGSRRGAQRTLAIRHVSDHRIIALLEIVSPANKDRASHVEQFIDKAENALLHGIHLLLIDLLPPGKHDPAGMHGALWERLDDVPYELPPHEALTLAAYRAEARPEVYVEHLAVGAMLTAMPLFLDTDYYIKTPLEQTYMTAYRGLPAFWREILDTPSS